MSRNENYPSSFLLAVEKRGTLVMGTGARDEGNQYNLFS